MRKYLPSSMDRGALTLELGWWSGEAIMIMKAITPGIEMETNTKRRQTVNGRVSNGIHPSWSLLGNYCYSSM